MKYFWIDPPLWFIACLYGLLSAWTYRGVATFAVGLAVWSLWEYINHRWILHRLLVSHHRLHHMNPAKYVSLPLVVSSLGVGMFAVLAAEYVSGIIAGYVSYEVAHRLATPWHAKHHKDSSIYFGVSSPAWDWVMGTR